MQSFSNEARQFMIQFDHIAYHLLNTEMDLIGYENAII